MKPIMRTYQTEEDYWRIREFLREVSMLNSRHDFSWPLLRWDYWRWHVNENIFHFDLCEVVHLWEANGQIVAMLNPDGSGEAFFMRESVRLPHIVLLTSLLSPDVAAMPIPIISACNNIQPTNLN